MNSNASLSDLKQTGEFYFDEEGHMCCGRTRISTFAEIFLKKGDFSQDESVIDLTADNELVQATTKLLTPVVIYSKRRLVHNIQTYMSSFERELTAKYGIKTHISYSLKANYNPSILKLFREHGAWSSLVNKNELKLALKVGIKGENLIFNGNGKKMYEINLAIRSGCYINIDSLFNLKDTIKCCSMIRANNGPNFRAAKVLFRVNVSTTAQVHSYLDTCSQSKFGIQSNLVEPLIELAKSNENLITLVGFHIHLGSTIKTLDVYRNSVANLVGLINSLVDKYHLETIELINFGGGLGIDYERHSHRTCADSQESKHTQVPSPADLAELIADNVKNLRLKEFKVVVEPGRSLVGDSSILLSSIIGVKQNDNKNFMVIDASMCECIRPCLYSAYHHIDYVKPPGNNCKRVLVDVVGPVCESGDFLGKNRLLPLPDDSENDRKDQFLAVMDVGAYCSSMANNYNLHQRPAEIFIDEIEIENQTKAKYLLTRRPENLDDILNSFIDY